MAREMGLVRFGTLSLDGTNTSEGEQAAMSYGLKEQAVSCWRGLD